MLRPPLPSPIPHPQHTRLAQSALTALSVEGIVSRQTSISRLYEGSEGWRSQNWSFSREYPSPAGSWLPAPVTTTVWASVTVVGMASRQTRIGQTRRQEACHQTCGLRDTPPLPSRPNLPVQPHPPPPSGTSVTVDESTFRQTRDRQWGHWTDKGETAWTEGKRTDRGLDRQRESGQTEGETGQTGRSGQTGQTGGRVDRLQGDWTDRGRVDRERRDMESGQTMDRLT